jgi:prepilin peptidase CpaA
MLVDLAVLLVFPAAMAFCAVNDVVTMTIPNIVSILAVALFPPIALLAGLDAIAIGWHLACGFAVLVVTFTLFALSVFGGGDAKMMAAAAVWIGFDLLMQYILVVAYIGGGLTLVLLVCRQYPWPALVLKQPWIARLTLPKGGIPYGVALGAAAVILYPSTAVWKAATSLA